MPGAGRMNVSDRTLPLPVTGLVEVNTGGPVQVSLLNRLKVMVPVGFKPFDRVAVSNTDMPTVPAEAVVTSVGFSRLPAVVSAGSAQAVGPAGALLGSPL